MRSNACGVAGCRSDRRTRRPRGSRRQRQRTVPASGGSSNLNCTGRVVPAVTVSVSPASSGARVPIRNTVERPSWVSVKRRCAWCLRRRSGRNVDAAQQLPVREHVGVVGGDEIPCRDGTFGPVGAPQRVGGVERHRQRDHRSGRQRHADVAADGGRVPHLERGEERIAARGATGLRPANPAAAQTRTAPGPCTWRRSAGPHRMPREPASPTQRDRSDGSRPAAARRTTRCLRRAMRRPCATARPAVRAVAG